LRDLQELSVAQAVSLLLTTPRSLRHALGRTLVGWRSLYGEIDWNHLFAVNVLRFAAPECFLFVVRRWERLHGPPSADRIAMDHVEQIRQGVADDWNRTIQNVEWNVVAARRVMEFILPACEAWLVNRSRASGIDDTRQGVQHERYWSRAVNESLDQSDVRDQAVIRDIRRWLEAPNPDADVITGLVTSSEYSDLWEHFAGRFLVNQPDQILLVCELTLHRIRQQHGAAASHDSQGFVATWRFANRRVPVREVNREWLQTRMTEAASTSIELLNGLWHYYGTPGRSSLRPEDVNAVRQYEIQALQSVLVDGEALGRVIDTRYPYAVFQLVFDLGDHNPNGVGDVPAWAWLGPILLDALRRGNALAATGVSSLITARDSGLQREPWAVEPGVLFGFFPTDAEEVVDRLSGLAERIVDSEQQQLVRAIAESARITVQQRGSDAENE